MNETVWFIADGLKSTLSPPVQCLHNANSPPLLLVVRNPRRPLPRLLRLPPFPHAIPKELKAVWITQRDYGKSSLKVSEPIDRLDGLKTRTFKADLSVGM